MIDTSKSYQYKTVDGRAVVMLTKQKMIGDKRIYIGVVEGIQGYQNWTQDGRAWNSNHTNIDLKDAE